MQRRERGAITESERHTRGVLAALGLCATALCAQAADEAPFRYRAPITVQQAGTFVHLPLPVSAYAHSVQPGLQDLRVVDSAGQRVPFALLAPRAAEAQQIEQASAATLYPLPPKPAAGGTWTSPVEVQVQGDRIRVISKGGRAPQSGSARSGGWLIDLGDRGRDDPPPQSLRLQWSGPAEFSAGFGIETSDDLRGWRAAGQGQVMALRATSGTLTQPLVMLPPNAGRFVRLAWADVAAAPALTGAQVIASLPRNQVLDAPTELTFAASAEPAGSGAADSARTRAAHFDLGAVLPLVQLDLKLAPGTLVVPAQVQGRNRSEEPWRDLSATVFYRLDRGADSNTSPPLPLRATVRYLRVVPDARAAPLVPEQTQLAVQAQLLGLVFAAQGQAPFVLQAGSGHAATSALPVTTLVPALADERARFGRASLGVWSEEAEVARAEAAQARQAALRPWLLWAVLLAGVAVLGLMVWKLARTKPAAAGATTPPT